MWRARGPAKQLNRIASGGRIFFVRRAAFIKSDLQGELCWLLQNFSNEKFKRSCVAFPIIKFGLLCKRLLKSHFIDIIDSLSHL